MLGENTNVNKASSVGNYLSLYLGQNQGVRLGESVVVSTKAHARMPEKRVKGQIKILLNRDAGKYYLHYVEEDQVIHVDVYHKPGSVDPRVVAQSIYNRLEEHFIAQDPQLQYAEKERFKIIVSYMNKIIITANLGKGLMYSLYQGMVEPFLEDDEGLDHVHVLAKFNREEYNLIFVIAQAMEEAVLASDIKLAKVRNINHGNQKQEEADFSSYLKLPWKSLKGQNAHALPDKENVNQLIMKLAEKIGGIDEIEEFMQNYSTNIFKRKGIQQQKKKWGDVEYFVGQLEELGIIQSAVLGKVLSKRGMKLKEFIINHKCELETEIRRNMRQTPGNRGRFKKLGQVKRKTSVVEFTNKNKTINNPEGNWSRDLAVPETVVQAVKNSFLRGDNHLTIQKSDLHYYDKKTYIPIDVCLVVDGSGSMAGDKRQAACYLAEHLLLTGKEKVAVVTFQERSSQVVVPFTRNHNVLRKGLAALNPAGLTPLASGIDTAHKLIKNSKVRNPLMVLITDGIPNIPLWTLDAKADALAVAEQLRESKVRFICIGLESNRQFLEKMIEKADGSLYLVDDLNRDNLINIVHSEKSSILAEARLAK